MTRPFFILLFISGTACSMLEQTKTQEFQMTWQIKPEEKNQENSLVELSFVDFPGGPLEERSGGSGPRNL
jgi:hypothetical protein